MTATWQTVLPAIVGDARLRTWRTSGWIRRPRPLPETYLRARNSTRR